MRARVGNPRTPEPLTPPTPPEGGERRGQLFVEETYVTERGRSAGAGPVDLGAVGERLRAAGKEDLAAWEQVRALLRDGVGEMSAGYDYWVTVVL